MNNLNIICASENNKCFLCLNKKSEYCIADENINITLNTGIKYFADYIECISGDGNKFSVFNTQQQELSVYNCDTGNQIFKSKFSELYTYAFFNNCILFLVEYKNETNFLLSLVDINSKVQTELCVLENADFGDFNFYDNQILVIYKSLIDNKINLLKIIDFGNNITSQPINNIHKNVNTISIRLNEECSKIIYSRIKSLCRKSEIILSDINNNSSRKLLSVPFKKIHPIQLALNLSYISEQYFSITYENELCIYDISNKQMIAAYPFNKSDSLFVVTIYDNTLVLNKNNQIIKTHIKNNY